MAHLVPIPFPVLLGRLFRELETADAAFDLPRRKFFLGDAAHDLSVRFHDLRAASPLGPAAGPQTQMAQNLVLSWLGGSRILELKTVQIKDDLVIPRPCIDMRTVGYNAEWSQELKLAESLEEYVKGAMLIAMLRASGAVSLAPGFDDTIFDMSVGYDLAGIRSPSVDAFLGGLLDARPHVARFRREIPAEYARFRDLEFPTRLSSTLTLSTFHGCPPAEIERIIEHLLDVRRLHCIVKFNPMLLGAAETRRLLGEMGYAVRVPDTAFTRDARWDDAVGIVERLARRAAGLGLGFGVKFSNTLIVENDGSFLPASEKEVYLSGPPLHVLAMHLVARFRRHFGDAVPISFAAGVDAVNFPDAVALGLVPVTTCSDLLKPGGYGRLAGYSRELLRRMTEVGAPNVEEFIRRAYGGARGAGSETPDLSAARLRNTETYVAGLVGNPRYGAADNAKLPKKIGRHLWRFDCISCDKCIPVCPNDALFTFRMPSPVVMGRTLEEDHQIAVFADACNACGNCDVFCPEDGGPYVEKPAFFGSEAAYRAAAPLPGFFVTRNLVLARIDGAEYRLESRLDGAAPRRVFSGAGDVDPGVAALLEDLRTGVLTSGVNPVSTL